MSGTINLDTPSHVPPALVIDFDAARDPALQYDVFQRLDEIRHSAPPSPTHPTMAATG